MSGDTSGPREQRLVFGEDPDLYDRARPGYPSALVDDVLDFVHAGPDGGAGGRAARRAGGGVNGSPSACRALEVGAGTGKATVGFASRGVTIVALEPDPGMARLAARNCAGFASVHFEQSGFEDWEVEESSFDLVFSAQAWHWVRPEVRDVKAASVLRPAGAVALFWHRVRWTEGDPFRVDLDRVYRDLAPGLLERGPGFPGPPPGFEEQMRGEVEASGAWGQLSERRYPWTASYTPDGYVELLSTQSDHRLLAENVRNQLLGAVREVADRHGGSGGAVNVPHETYLLLGRPAGKVARPIRPSSPIR